MGDRASTGVRGRVTVRPGAHGPNDLQSYRRPASRLSLGKTLVLADRAARSRKSGLPAACRLRSCHPGCSMTTARGHDPGRFTRPLLVGRRAELDVLDGALALARGGQPQLVLVEGDAGIGKTALVDRFLGTARHDVVVLPRTRRRAGVASRLRRGDAAPGEQRAPRGARSGASRAVPARPRPARRRCAAARHPRRAAGRRRDRRGGDRRRPSGRQLLHRSARLRRSPSARRSRAARAHGSPRCPRRRLGAPARDRSGTAPRARRARARTASASLLRSWTSPSASARRAGSTVRRTATRCTCSRSSSRTPRSPGLIRRESPPCRRRRRSPLSSSPGWSDARPAPGTSSPLQRCWGGGARSRPPRPSAGWTTCPERSTRPSRPGSSSSPCRRVASSASRTRSSAPRSTSTSGRRARFACTSAPPGSPPARSTSTTGSPRRPALTSASPESWKRWPPGSAPRGRSSRRASTCARPPR